MKVDNLTRITKTTTQPCRRKPSNHKVEFNQNCLDVFLSLIKYEQGILKLDETNLETIQEQITFDNFEIELEILNESVKKKIYRNVLKKVPVDGVHAVRVYITNRYIENAECIELYTLLGATIPFSARKYQYYDILQSDKKRCRYKVLDLYYIFSFLKVLDKAQSFIEGNRENFFMLEDYHRYYNYYDETYISKICDLSFIQNLHSIKDINIVRFVADIYSLIIFLENQNTLEELNDNEVSKAYARAFETKKNIPDKILKIMSSSKFLKDFKFVELDELIDLHKFNLIEDEYLNLREKLYFNNLFYKDMAPEIRFRRLGKHNALGMYFPKMNCICIDIKSPSSFLHEIAHYIDIANPKGQLSKQYDFLKLHRAYTLELDANINAMDDVYKKAYRSKRNYYHIFTEVFARSLELYLSKIKKLDSSLIKSCEDFIPQRGYPNLTQSLEKLIVEYFEGFININENPSKDALTDTHSLDLKIVPVKGLNQLTFL